MNHWFILLCSLSYLLLLFGIATWVEKSTKRGLKLINNPYVYALSMAVYCTAWTFYGSVGRASVSGIEFLYIYLGPSLGAPLVFLMLRKIIRISKTHSITSIADFISTRYGKNISLGAIVTVLCITGIIPYIAIQLKAISESIKTISSIATNEANTMNSGAGINNTVTFLLVIGITVFIILFGTRKVDATEKHEGMMVAIAFESVIKLFAFLIAGAAIVYVLFNGWNDLFVKATALPTHDIIASLQGEHIYFHLFLLMTLSMFAVLFLPRQFQVAVVENVNEDHLKKAVWLFPLYLLLINIFVLPVSIAGGIHFGSKLVNADTYILALPMLMKSNWLTLLVYIGGFSAASSMIIIETIALTTMVSNNIVAPVFFSLIKVQDNIDKGIRNWLKTTRRIGIIFIMILAYLFERFVAEKFSLVSIGLVSFVAVAQFAPSIIGGVYWKRATKQGSLASIIIGFIVWFYTLVIPSIVEAGYLSHSIIESGPWGIGLLNPAALFGLNGFDLITHGFMWSILVNAISFFGVSLATERTPQEIYQAELFVDVYKQTDVAENENWVLNRTASMLDLKTLMLNLLGKDKTAQLLASYEKRHKVDLSKLDQAPPHLISVIEKVLSGNIGSATAKLMINNIVRQKEVGLKEVLNIIKESQEVKASNIELKKESSALNKLTEELRVVNNQLKRMDEMKDEFLYTVTHEIRTPLTSIRALSEILQDNPDLEEDEKNTYLEAVVKETERLSHLITQVLNLERYESGRQKLNTVSFDLSEAIMEVLNTTDSLRKEKGLKWQLAISSLPNVKGDKDLLKQVIYNLVTNAIKFSKHQIIVSGLKEQRFVVIKVIDDGEGVAPEWHELIFDKFFQAQNQTLKKPEGSGLGLAISKRIIEMHNGRIWVESTPGEGATFCIKIPLT
jgi:Na+/proline symporter/nitrogen-specific signal transduction histidine kinase